MNQKLNTKNQRIEEVKKSISKSPPYYQGFSTIEVALSFALLAMIFAMTMPMYRTFMIRNDLDIAVTTLVQDYRRAQILSQVADGDSGWGVHVGTGSILIYKGVNYVTRDIPYDEETVIPSSISISGISSVTFGKQTGIPNTVGTTTFTSINNETRNVTINQKGMVDY